MALYVKRDEQRSQLQEKVASELQNKIKASQVKAADVDPAMLEKTHETRPAGMIIIILSVCIVLAIVIIFVKMTQG